MKNEAWPDFVTGSDDAEATRTAGGERTGWETVVFELDDDEIQELLSGLSSAFSTAADAP